MADHKHESSTTCRCGMLALEPHEKCPIHGAGEWQPRCSKCGRFYKQSVVVRDVRVSESVLCRTTAEVLSLPKTLLLAESEPEPVDECPFPSPEHKGESGCPCNPIDGVCVYCGAPESGPDAPEPEPPMKKLARAFLASFVAYKLKRADEELKPRSSHEPRN